ncbi:MAG TPA: ABC transporter substrate-binding protein [Propionibacterium sp.]|nr:ABC transporter substrate-binding protein [Propionibacterium sp.]
MEAISRRTFVKLGAGAAALSFGGLVSACTSGDTQQPADSSAGASSSAGVKQVVVTMPANSEPEAGFDPTFSWGCGEHVHEPLIQSTLITTDLDLGFVNDLATGYEVSADGMAWTFTLRDDVRFSDGEKLTAEDVAFTINGILDSEAAQADLSSIKEAVASDDTTVVLHMTHPDNTILYTLAVVGIVPTHAYDRDYGSNPIGSGRYRLEQWDRGQQVILTANPDYYGPAPKVGRVVVLFMSEDASLAAAAAGQVDVAYTSATLAGQVPAGFSLFSAKTVDSRGISLPSIPAGSAKEDYQAGNDVTSDLALRQAMNTAVDRDRMVAHVLNGHGTAAFSVGDALPWASPDMKVSSDVERARQVLADGGWTTGADGIVAKDGVRAAFDLYYPSSDSVRQALAADFADQMRQIGIEVSPRGASWDDIYPHQYSSPVLWGWGSNSPVELYQLTHSKGWGNYACYDNGEIDAHLDRARAARTVEDSYEPYREAQWDEATQTGVAPQGASTWVWLANIDHLYFQRDGITIAQQKPHPHGHGWSLVNNVDQWDV